MTTSTSCREIDVRDPPNARGGKPGRGTRPLISSLGARRGPSSGDRFETVLIGWGPATAPINYFSRRAPLLLCI